MQTDIWTAREGITRLADELAGYKVGTHDGEIGAVDRVSYSGSCLYVSTGRIRTKRYVIPAGIVERVNNETRTVSLALRTEEVENAPKYDQQRGLDEESEMKTAAYYSAVLAKRRTDR